MGVYKNLAFGRVATIPVPAISGTLLTLQTGQVARFPDSDTQGQYFITIWANNAYPDPSTAEICAVTSEGISGADQMTIVRAQRNSVARTILVGDCVALGVYKEDFDSAATIIKNEVPSGTVNGSTTAFTTLTAFSPNTLAVYQNGIRLKNGLDFTENGGKTGFTMTAAPLTGDLLVVEYLTNPTAFLAGSNTPIKNEIPTGTINGVNAVFTTAQTPVNGSQEVYIDGLLQSPTTDYTLSGSTITFVVAPVTSSDIRVHYLASQTTIGNAATVNGYLANAVPTANQIPVLDANKTVGASGITAPSTDHINLTPGTNKLVELAALRQDNVTNTYKNKTVILTGWGYIAGAAATSITKAITFGLTFNAPPVLITSFVGAKLIASGAPASIGDLTSIDTSNAGADSITTTGSNVRIVRTGGNLDSTFNYGFSWIAIGELP